jgi:hypothetical protein
MLVAKTNVDLQAEIDKIPTVMPDVKVLVIQSNGNYEDLTGPLQLNLSLPNLETLKILDVPFSRITLNKKLTPKLYDLELQNIGDEPRVDILLPTLKTLSVSHVGGPWVKKMFKAATQLERLDCYKCGMGRDVVLASNALRYVNLHRSDCLRSVTLYAPPLEYLSLQACYDLENLQFQDQHRKLTKSLPPDFTAPSRIEVVTTNAVLSSKIEQILKENPRIVVKDESEDLY